MLYLQFKQDAAENDAVVGSVNQNGTNPSEDNNREANTLSATVYITSNVYMIPSLLFDLLFISIIIVLFHFWTEL